MNNNELLKIKDKKEQFYMLRKEIIGDSCREEKNCYQNPPLRKSILNSLEWDGFDLEEQGTQYLASLITIFFHERKLYRRKDIEDKSYWDISDYNNEHYRMLGTSKENVINAILYSIFKNETEFGSIEEIVYELADEYGYYGRDRDDRKRVPYTKLLKK